MKKLLYLIAVLGLGSLTPVTNAAPAQPAPITIPVDSALTPAQQKAVRTYVIASMRASAEAMLAQAESTNPTLRQILQTALTANNAVSLEGLPANYQEFILESRALGQESIDSFRGLDKTLDQLSPADAQQMQESMADVMARNQALEAKYPEVSKYLGVQALSGLSEELTIKSGIQQKVLAEVMAQAADLDGDQAALTQLALKISCRLLLEEINKLSAE